MSIDAGQLMRARLPGLSCGWHSIDCFKASPDACSCALAQRRAVKATRRKHEQEAQDLCCRSGAAGGTGCRAGVLGALEDQGPGEGFVSGNGRIEATEVAVATKQAGRVPGTSPWARATL